MPTTFAAAVVAAPFGVLGDMTFDSIMQIKNSHNNYKKDIQFI